MSADEPAPDERVLVVIGTPAQVAATVQELQLFTDRVDLTLSVLGKARTSTEAIEWEVGEPFCGAASNDTHDDAPGECAPHCPAVEISDFDRAVALLRRRHQLLHTQCLVLALRFRGYENEEAAHALGVETATVKFHVSNVLRRIGVEPRTRVPRIFADAVSDLRETTQKLPEELDSAWLMPLQRALRRLRHRGSITNPALDALASGRAQPRARSKSKADP